MRQKKSRGSLEPLGGSIALEGDLPWWERLPLDFSERRQRFDVRGLSRLVVATAAAMDRAVCTLGAAGLTAVFAPLTTPKAVARQLAHLEFYGQRRFIEDPASFFVQPGDVTVRRKPVRVWLRAPRGAKCEELSFEGAFDTVNPASRQSYLSHERNRVSRARYYFHGDRPRPTVLALHGFWASPYWMNAFMFEIPFLFRLGLDVVLPTMPFHGDRRMQGAVFSGQGFVSPHLDLTFEAIAHTVSDVRVLLRWLRSRGVAEVGISGVSLGGYIAALLASLEPSLAFAIPTVPVVSVIDLLLDWTPLNLLIRRSMKQAGLSVSDARRMFAVHHALSYPPKLPTERLMIIAGAGDRMASPAQARLLWEHWGRPEIYYFPGNHMLHLDRGGYLRAQARFLARNGLLPPRPPRSGD